MTLISQGACDGVAWMERASLHMTVALSFQFTRIFIAVVASVIRGIRIGFGVVMAFDFMCKIVELVLMWLSKSRQTGQPRIASRTVFSHMV